MFAESHIVRLSQTALKSTFISRVACGERHVLFLTSSGFVYSMGSNEFGQLGNPCEEIEQDDGSYTTITYQNEPAIIFGLLNQKVVDISCGTNHCAILSQARSPIGGFAKPKATALKTMQEVFVWGSNMSQQIGLPASITSLDTPQPVENLQGTSIDKVLCGRQFTAMRAQEDHSLFVFGISQLSQ